MNSITQNLQSAIAETIGILYHHSPSKSELSLQKTRKEFEGDFTLVVFPFTRFSGKKPEETGSEIGELLSTKYPGLQSWSVVKGFLNLKLSDSVWIDFFNYAKTQKNFGFKTPEPGTPPVLVEYSSPNTNKPLHLGHIRNNLLGFSVARLLEASGNNVKKVNVVNDRGVHICKSMLAYQLSGEKDTPESTGKKGDHLVGDFYVAFDALYKKQIAALVESGMDKERAEKEAPVMNQIQEMLIKWEAGDPAVRALWEKMNSWVYNGFDITYKRLGVDFTKIYYESETYLSGKKIVEEGLQKGIFYKKEDNSVWIDLRDEGLDEKLVLRRDGTSVYITQDIGTCLLRYNDFSFNRMIYVVGNEQDYHFKVLFKIVEKLDYAFAKGLSHLSYGMVELPEGKMKSREGTVVDADDLMDVMEKTAAEMTEEMGKTKDLNEQEKTELARKIGMGALKYFILKVDPKKKMLFNPRESIDFQGNTGPFIQYTYARICSVLRKKNEVSESEKLTSDIPKPGNEIKNDSHMEGHHTHESINSFALNQNERDLLALLYDFPMLIEEGSAQLSPSLVANYAYALAREFNQFYHEHHILKEKNELIKNFRIELSDFTGKVLTQCFWILGIEGPERM